MTGERKKAKCAPVKPEACSDPEHDTTTEAKPSVMHQEKPVDIVKFERLCDSLRFSWDENCFDRYQASIEACTAEQQQILKSIRDRKVNSESNAAYGYRRNGEADYVVQQCWDLVRLLQRLKFSKTDAPADKRTLNGDDVTQIQITECVVVQGAFKLDV